MTSYGQYLIQGSMNYTGFMKKSARLMNECMLLLLLIGKYVITCLYTIVVHFFLHFLNK